MIRFQEKPRQTNTGISDRAIPYRDLDQIFLSLDVDDPVHSGFFCGLADTRHFQSSPGCHSLMGMPPQNNLFGLDLRNT